MAAVWLEWQAAGKMYTKAINDQSRLTVGRRPDSDILLDDPFISREQALLYFEQGSFLVRNISHKVPILFNHRWHVSHNQVAVLQPGDILRFGKMELSVTASQSPMSRKRPPVLFRVSCPSCDRVLDHDLAECPWCEASLASAEALFFHTDDRLKVDQDHV